MVCVHLAVVIVHASSHLELSIYLPPLSNAYVMSVIVIAPLVAAALLWTRFGRTGAMLLLALMAGSLVFGTYNHFAVAGIDHILDVPPEAWRIPFQVTALLLTLTEGVGCWVGVWTLRRMIRTTHGSAERGFDPAEGRGLR